MASTKDKIVELAREYIQRVGYHSFTYKQIATQLNIKNAAIHHYYPSKEDLGLAVIALDFHEFTILVNSLENNAPLEKIDALLSNYRRYFKEGKKLCIIGTFGSSSEDTPIQIHKASTSYQTAVITWLTDTFNKGKKLGAFNFTQSTDDLITIWVAALPGSLIAGRLRGELYFKQTINSLRDTLKIA